MMDSVQYPITGLSSPSQTTAVDVELDNKVKKASEKISENLHIFANEPSLACYRLQEHIQKSLPQLVIKRLEVNQVHRELQGKCYDLEYSINAVKSIHKSREHFLNTRDMIRRATAAKQRLSSREEATRGAEQRRKGHGTSVYQRFSGSFDLPSSFLPSSGLSASASASADLKASPLLPKTSSPGGRRARASSVSSTPSHTPASRVHSTSCSPKKSGTQQPLQRDDSNFSPA